MKKTAAAAVFAAAVLGGIGVATALVLTGEAVTTSASCAASSEALLANRIVGSSQSYKRDNPTESTKVFAYLNGGTRPDPISMTHMGKHLVFTEDDCRALAPVTTTTSTTTTTTTTTNPPPLAACADGLDNDADGKIDFPADPGCLSASDNDETDAPPPPPGSANLWIDTNGGTCTRSAPAGYVDAAACGSLDAAYDKASCGDLVLVKGGIYGSNPTTDVQSITGDNTCGVGNEKVIAAAAGETPQFGTIAVPDTGSTCPNGGPDNLVLRGFTLIGGINLAGGTNLTVDSMDGGSFGIDCVVGAVVENSDWGPCHIGSPSNPCRNHVLSDGSDAKPHIWGASNVTIKGNLFHDIDIYPGSGAHAECLQLNNGGSAQYDVPANNISIIGNRFYNCETNAISMGYNAAYLTGTMIIAKNWFGQKSPQTNNFQLNITSYPMNADIYVIYNSFVQGQEMWCEGGCGTGGGSGHEYAYGNIFGADSVAGGGAECSTGWTCDYNAWFHTSGGGSVGNHATILTSPLPYVNGSGVAAMNYHLTGGNVAGIDNALPAGCSSWGVVSGTPYDGSDWDNQVRPQNSPNCDAGADERNQ